MAEPSITPVSWCEFPGDSTGEAAQTQLREPPELVSWRQDPGKLAAAAAPEKGDSIRGSRSAEYRAVHT